MKFICKDALMQDLTLMTARDPSRADKKNKENWTMPNASSN